MTERHEKRVSPRWLGARDTDSGWGGGGWVRVAECSPR